MIAEEALSATRRELGRYGVWRMGGDTTAAFAVAAERAGFASIWYGGVDGTLSMLRRAADATERIMVASGVVNIFNTRPDDVAEAFRAIDRAHPGRILLGVGPGHPERTDLARRPLGALHAYIAALIGGGVPAERVVVAALGPRVLTFAATHTAGAHPYLVTPRHTATARARLGAAPLLVPEQRVVLDTDRGAAIAAARPGVEFYFGLRNYRRNLERMGFSATEITERSTRILEALVVSGGPAEVRAGLDAHLDAGADHVLAQVIAREDHRAEDDLAELTQALGLTPSA